MLARRHHPMPRSLPPLSQKRTELHQSYYGDRRAARTLVREHTSIMRNCRKRPKKPKRKSINPDDFKSVRAPAEKLPKFELQNVVATFNLGVDQLDLRAIALECHVSLSHHFPNQLPEVIVFVGSVTLCEFLEQP